MSRADPREAILAAATETFARFGFGKTSIDDIARRAAIGKGTVYLHFETKEELFGAVIRRIWTKVIAELEAVVRSARTPQDKVRAYLECRQGQIVQIARDLRVSEAAVLEIMPLAEPHLREPRARETWLLERIAEEGTAQGVFAVANARLLAEGMSACLEALDEFLVAPEGQALQRALAEVYDVFVRGLLAPRDAPGRRAGKAGAGAPRRRAARG